MPTKSKLREQVKEKMLKVGEDRILDLTDLELKSNSAFYGVCKTLKISPKSFIVKWPKCFLDRREKWASAHKKRQSDNDKSVVEENKKKKNTKNTKKVVKRTINKQEEALLSQNREADYRRVLKLNKSLYEEIEVLKKIIETHQDNSARVSILDKEKKLLEEKICTLRAKLDDAKNEYRQLVDYYEEQDNLFKRSNFICPSCGSVVSSKNVENINSGHKLIVCSFCKNKNAIKKEELELVFHYSKRREC